VGHAQTTAPPKPAYVYATNGVIAEFTNPRGVKWKLVLDESNLGGKELEAAEVTLPAGTATGAHMHGVVEALYVLSGTYDHEVNGKTYRLTPGMVGVVRPGDTVRHLVPADTGEAKLLILWSPGGEAVRAFSSASPKITPPPVPELQR
jgi:quercetin dioxygenase-like cupin family protein